MNSHPRMQREIQTITLMIQLYCRLEHRSTSILCPECQQIHDYAMTRLDRCPFQEQKPVCAKCQVHCYQPKMRSAIRKVMRVAGPQMLWKHPILTLRHLVDQWDRARYDKKRKD